MQERGTIVVDGKTEKGQAGGNLVETFELHKFTPLPTFLAHPNLMLQ
jgi:hypothetical protein